MAAATQKPTVTHTVAQFVGHHGTERRILKADQDGLIGVKGIAKDDLVWPAGNRTKVDVTTVHESVLEYLKSDSDFKITEVEAPAAS